MDPPQGITDVHVHIQPWEQLLPEVRAAISGNLCRCTGYVNIVKAVLDAAEVTA